MEDSERYKMQRNLSFWVKSKTRNRSRAEGNKGGQGRGEDSNVGGGGRECKKHMVEKRNIWRQVPGVLDQEF